MKYVSWRDHADRVLAELYNRTAAEGCKPTKQEIFDAYPFGMRQYEPYKVWLEQKKRWERGEPLRKTTSKGRERTVAPLIGQESLL